MDPTSKHEFQAKRSFDGGELDCGNGLLLLIRKNLDLLEDGQLLEVLSLETSVEEDLPAWCRLTGNQLISWTKVGRQRSYLICRGKFSPKDVSGVAASSPVADTVSVKSASFLVETSTKTESEHTTQKTSKESSQIKIKPFAVMGVGSWPRPKWLFSYLQKHLEGKLSDEDFDQIANDAVELCVASQAEAGVAVFTDGEQRRDSYASFVGQKLDGCQLIPLTDLLPLVDDPEDFAGELQSLDVPADKVRHPAVMAKLSRRTSFTLQELLFLKKLVKEPIKIALPGPYLLSRIMWMECITDKVYSSRDELSNDIVVLLREEIQDLLEHGAAIVQLDEPVLSEIVFKGAKNKRSFMCGALSERGSSEEELSFASRLLNEVCRGFPKDRLAMHVCRGNWTPDESAALSGSYEALLPVFNSIPVGTLFLEYCTPRAGDLSALKGLRKDVRIGLGAVNPKSKQLESLEEVLKKAEDCISIVGPDRVWLNPDCGFATFADNPVSSRELAGAKLGVLRQASEILQEKYYK